MEGMHPIKAWRQAERLTVEAAAARLKVSKAAVSRWERGERAIAPALVSKVARATGIAPRELRPDWAETLEAAS